MNRKIVLSALFWAATVGGLLALVTGDRQAVSLRLWLAGFAGWFALATLISLLKRVPLGPSTIRPAFRWRAAKPVNQVQRLRHLRFIESLLLRARDNERAHSQQLRPRLEALADHYLPVVHGIDRRSQPGRANALLGDLEWLIGEENVPRTPTFAEIDEFVARVTTPAVADSTATSPDYAEEVA